MQVTQLASELLRYLVEGGFQPGDKLPTLNAISQHLGVSVAKTREELEVARAFGLVDIKPGRGMILQSYSFTPAVRLSALYAIGHDPTLFESLSEARNGLETHFWHEAAATLGDQDIVTLYEFIESARQQLNRRPITVPFVEHRQFHLTIFAKLGNPFVAGILETYWDAYEAFGLNLYGELSYHREVWDYHERMVDAIKAGAFDLGRDLLIEHMALLRHREATP